MVSVEGKDFVFFGNIEDLIYAWGSYGVSNYGLWHSAVGYIVLMK